MATKIQKPTVTRTEVEALTGTIHGKRFTVVLDDIHLSDEWEVSVLPVLQQDGIGKVHLTDGATEFEFKDAVESTIQFLASAGKLVVAKFFKTSIQEDQKDDSATESV